MTVGIVMLVHTALDRAELVARHWTASGCPVVIHVDQKVPDYLYDPFSTSLASDPLIRFCPRQHCEWGMWGIVGASQAAASMMLDEFPNAQHVYLASGSCLPLRPVQELVDYLAARPKVDFIESATTEHVPWTKGGLDVERFTLSFPFSWKRRKWLFDRWVDIQRRLKIKRQMPGKLVAHMGSQWWCLTRQTLSAILQDPDRKTYDRFFKKVWIPDESYFQTLARLYSTNIESRSLTLSKFDHQGKPHVFYDDHLQLLRRSDCFVARKIWPRANRLYEAFLTDSASAMKKTEPNPGRIDRIFSKATERRTRGRPGLIMQSRFPKHGWDIRLSAHQFSVFQGFVDLFEDFEPWLSRVTDTRVHGRLFAPDRAEFAGGETMLNGALSDDAVVRDYAPEAFLTNFIWNTRGERQCFQFNPADNQEVNWLIARDINAQVSVISGAWAIPLFHSNHNFQDIRIEAARLQKIESDYLNILQSPHCRARIRIWNLAEFIESPVEALQSILTEVAPGRARHVEEMPKMVDLQGFGQFLQNLKNHGMHPYLMGDFPSDPVTVATQKSPRRPYLVR